jgi:hypothetical protein
VNPNHYPLKKLVLQMDMDILKQNIVQYSYDEEEIEQDETYKIDTHKN